MPQTAKLTVLQENIEIIYGSTLTEAEKKEFDYLEAEELEESQFFKYKEDVFWLGNFMLFGNKPQAGELTEGWDASYGTGYFHAYVIKLPEDCQSVTLGQVTA